MRLRIDRDALAANWRALDAMSGSASAGAAVKANAYGLGVDAAVPTLRSAGARDFFVAHWSEVAGVLTHAAPERVSVLHGPRNLQDAAYARAIGVRPVINSIQQARLWLDAGGGPCDLMVDTGINRLGLPLSDIGDPVIAALGVDMLMSHLASADEDSTLNECQLARFKEAVQAIPARCRSLANSAGIALSSEYHFDATRPGLSLYGGIPRSELAGSIRQVVFPEAAIIQVRQVEAGESVGYNAIFKAEQSMTVGTVSLGYADGFLRSWGRKGYFTFGGASLPILGRVSMDMVVVDLGAAPAAREGDWLSVPYSLPEASEISGLSQYELLTVLGDRFSR